MHQINVLLAFGAGDRSELINASMERFSRNWQRIQSITNFLYDPAIKKQLYIDIENSIGLCNLFLEKSFDEQVRELLQRHRDIHSLEAFDFFMLT